MDDFELRVQQRRDSGRVLVFGKDGTLVRHWFMPAYDVGKPEGVRMLSDGRYLQLDANLRYFYDRYDAILAERDASRGFLAGLWRNDARDEAREAYYAYIEAARAKVLQVAARLADRPHPG